MSTTGVELIAKERQRQIEALHFDEANDRNYNDHELPKAAAAYALAPTFKDEIMFGDETPKPFWPFKAKWWKPSPENRVKELAKAGALIAAEIDRILAKTKYDN